MKGQILAFADWVGCAVPFATQDLEYQAAEAEHIRLAWENAFIRVLWGHVATENTKKDLAMIRRPSLAVGRKAAHLLDVKFDRSLPCSGNDVCLLNFVRMAGSCCTKIRNLGIHLRIQQDVARLQVLWMIFRPRVQVEIHDPLSYTFNYLEQHIPLQRTSSSLA